MTQELGLLTPSLRRRVTLSVLVLIGAMLLVVAVVTELVLQGRLDGQLRQRLTDRAGIAVALADKVDARDLARRLEGDGVSVVLRTSSGTVYAEGPLSGGSAKQAAATGATPGTPPTAGPGAAPPKARAAQVKQSGRLLSVRRDLPGGSTVVLVVDSSEIGRTLTQVRLALVLAAGVVLLVAAIAVPPVVSGTLRPLNRITEVARSITAGDRGRRLRPRQPATELGRTAVAFDEMLDELVGAETRSRETEQRLREFLSDAAHELRTPLSGVQAAAEHLLRDDPPRAGREQTLLGLVRETRRAGRLVEDMLTMARIDSGLVLHRTSVDLREVASRAAQSRSLVGTPVEVVVVGEPRTVDADPDRLTQVVTNLLDNAVHAARSCVRVEVWAHDGETGLSVEDDGPGVPLDQRERIFERLVRLDESRTAHRGGAGLGLSIARGIVVAHGGDLRCLSREDGGPGARFRLSLPVTAAAGGSAV